MKIRVKITRQENANYFNKSIGDIVTVDFDEYVAAVVASEIGNAAIEACKAQAVAARTFAIRYAQDNTKSISDASNTAQAYRAPRYDNKTYPNAIAAVQQTANEILTYNDKPINPCSYSNNNGGRTVSSETRWGDKRPYLIEKDDPWDAAWGGKRTGHGVGLSQNGAKYAAKIGKTYKDILNFYYPGTKIQKVGDDKVSNDKVQKIINWAESMVGTGYIYGATGWVCTPQRRQEQANQYPEYANTIMTTGAKWDGKVCHDCAQFVRKAMAQVDISLPSGATSQWKANIWESKGTTADIDPNKMCLLFRRDGNVMQHVLLYCGNGYVIDARGTSNGVMKTKLGVYKYTHWAIPKGLYDDATPAPAPAPKPEPTPTPTTTHPTLRKNTEGDEVKTCKNLLIRHGYMDAIGVYGDNTMAAVKAFQAANGLEADGICGPKTWNALENSTIPSNTTATVIANSGSTVNMRNSASKMATIIARVPLDTQVNVLEITNEWCKIEYNNRTGYMMTEFLKF